jgi:FKBP-type peptidyl-prolyl cis-trans isomerase 2
MEKVDFMGWYKIIVFTILVSLFGVSIQNIEAAGAKKGDKVTLEYTGMLDDGTVFDASSNHDKPLQFEVGGGRVIPGFDKAVTGMRLGEEMKFTIPPAKTYGKPNPKLIKKVSRKEIPQDRKPEVGMRLVMETPEGRKMQALITEVNPDYIILDLNHPLAGKALTFKIKVIKINH